MKGKKRSFYIFCIMGIIAAVMLVWGIVQLNAPDPVEEKAAVLVMPHPEDAVEEAIPPATDILEREFGGINRNKVMDDSMLLDSLRAGAVPTQEVGERGSLEGALVTNTPMKYNDTPYNYLPDSPLIEFTDDMIWTNGENVYTVKKDAIQAQALHIQEASIALSVAPRVEWGKTTGYRLVEIPKNSLFSKLGMVSGDIVVSINGQLPDMEPMALMFVNMVAGKRGHSTVVLEHRGVQRTVELRAAE